MRDFSPAPPSGMLSSANTRMRAIAMTFRRLFSALMPLAALLALSGCAGMSLDEPAPAKPAATARPAPAVVAPPPARPAVKPGGELNALRPSPRPTPEREVAGAPAGTPRLLGLSEEETVGLLGRPTEEEAQSPGKIWIYRAAGCQLSVHLFPDMEKGGFYALDYAAEGGRDACLGKVAGEARKRGGALMETSRAG